MGYLLTLLDWNTADNAPTKTSPATLALIGIFLVIGLSWFSFSAPSVIARWTQADYIWVVLAVSFQALIWVGLSFGKLEWMEKIPPILLLIWNFLFTISLLMTVLAHRVPFPQTPDSPAIVVTPPTWTQQLPLAFMLLLFPVIFLDLRVFCYQIIKAKPRPRDLIPGMLLGSFSLVVLVFMFIFTNVWGYIEPVSPWFRNKFWLPYLLMAGLITLFIGLKVGTGRK